MKKLQSEFVSRQYMLSRDYEVYYYSDMQFRSVGLHSHDYYELYFFVEGAVDMEIGGRSHRLKAGDVIVIPPGAEHRALVRDGSLPYRRFVFWASREFCEALAERSPSSVYPLRLAEGGRGNIFFFDVIDFNTLRGKLFSLLDEIHAERFARAERIALCVEDLLLSLGRLIYEQRQRKPERGALSTYSTVTTYIEHHLDEDLSLDQLSSRFYLSKYYISHLFQENTGLSLHQYIIKKRLAAAAGALRGGATVRDACAMCGFGDYSSFYRAFRKEYGVGPRDYGAAPTAMGPRPTVSLLTT